MPRPPPQRRSSATAARHVGGRRWRGASTIGSASVSNIRREPRRTCWQRPTSSCRVTCGSRPRRTHWDVRSTGASGLRDAADARANARSRSSDRRGPGVGPVRDGRSADRRELAQRSAGSCVARHVGDVPAPVAEPHDAVSVDHERAGHLGEARSTRRSLTCLGVELVADPRQHDLRADDLHHPALAQPVRAVGAAIRVDQHAERQAPRVAELGGTPAACPVRSTSRVHRSARSDRDPRAARRPVPDRTGSRSSG